MTISDHSTLVEAASRADAQIRRAEGVLDDAIEELSRGGRDAAVEAHAAWTSFDEAMQSTIRAHPYSSLAVAGLVGFLFAAARRH